MSSLFVERQWCRLLLLVLLGTSCAMALELKDVQITNEGRRYQSQLNFDVSGSVEQVIEILTDYEHPERLTPSVTKREVIGRHGAISRVRTALSSHPDCSTCSTRQSSKGGTSTCSTSGRDST